MIKVFDSHYKLLARSLFLRSFFFYFIVYRQFFEFYLIITELRAEYGTRWNRVPSTVLTRELLTEVLLKFI